MSKIEEVRKEEIIKEGVLRIIKSSEAVALQAVNSATTVLEAGLANAEDLTVKASDILLNMARRAINAGSIVGGDAREAVKNMTKGTIRTASEISSELKEVISVAAKKSKEETKSE